MSPQVLYVVGAVVALALIVEMVRRRTLREKYAVLWTAVGVVVLVVGLAPGLLTAAADLLGVEVPANLLFFVASLTLLLVSVQQSAELGRLEERTRTLAERCAELGAEVRRLQDDAPGADDRRRRGTDPGP